MEIEEAPVHGLLAAAEGLRHTEIEPHHTTLAVGPGMSSSAARDGPRTPMRPRLGSRSDRGMGLQRLPE